MTTRRRKRMTYPEIAAELARTRTVTLDMLRGMGACLSGRRKFAKVFPKGIRITARNLHLAYGSGLPVTWFASVLVNVVPSFVTADYAKVAALEDALGWDLAQTAAAIHALTRHYGL